MARPVRAGQPPGGAVSGGRKAADFDQIGDGYSRIRCADPRLTAAIGQAIGPAASIVNIGAGTGSYEPAAAQVVAAEPSAVMLDQHPGSRRVRAGAESLPFGTGMFDASMATLTVHHWSDLRDGLEEMKRVSRRQVVFTWDPDCRQELWLHSEYLPEMGDFERTRFPFLDLVVDLLGAHQVVPFLIPFDFTDGFQHAFWRRPEVFLDPRVRAASSLFAVWPDDLVQPAVERLAADLASGRWESRHGDLLVTDAVDYGYRIVVAGENLGQDVSS
jgi:SAM-dependent methyltransferase